LKGNNLFSEQTTAYFFKKIRSIHFSILGAVLLIGTIFYYLARTRVIPDDPSLISIVKIVGPVSGLLTIALAYFLPGWMMTKVAHKNKLGDKLSQYFRIHIIKLALLEGGVTVNLVCFFLVGDMLLLVFAGLAAIVIALNTPSISRISNDLLLNEEETRMLEDPVKTIN